MPRPNNCAETRLTAATAGEVRVLRRGHPIGQLHATRLAGLFGGQVAEQISRRNGLGAVGQLHFTFVLIVQERDLHLLWLAFFSLLSNSGEESRVAPEIFLRPFVEGMVVAFGALNLDAEKWRDVLAATFSGFNSSDV